MVALRDRFDAATGTYASQFAVTGPGESGFSPSQLTLGIGDVAPTVSAGGPYTVEQGHAVALQAVVSSNPDDDSLSYSWDINGNLGAATTGLVLEPGTAR